MVWDCRQRNPPPKPTPVPSLTSTSYNDSSPFFYLEVKTFQDKNKENKNFTKFIYISL